MLVAGAVLKVRCLALVGVTVDSLGVADVELHVVLGLRPRSSCAQRLRVLVRHCIKGVT